MAEIQIVGPPGTGKTTTLAALVARGVDEYGSDAVVVSSLTKAAAAELSGRGLNIPREHAGTLHSLCYRAIGAIPLVYSKIPDWNTAHPEYRMEEVDANPEREQPAQANKSRGDELAQEYDLTRHKMIPRELIPAHLRPFADAWESFKGETVTIDYTDMITMAYEHIDSAPGTPDAILADEVQDYSRLENALLRKWGAAARTLVLAGDPDQAIYEWRGADPGVFLNHDVGPNRRILSQSYRVPRAVHAVALRWIRQIQARIDAAYEPRDSDGGVRHQLGMRWKHPEASLRDIERWLAAGESIMVAATCDYMLAPTLAVLRREGIPFSNPWRRQNGAWNPLASRRKAVSMADRLIAYVRPDARLWGDGAPDGWSAEDLRRWTSVLRTEGILRRGAKAEIDRLGDDHTVSIGLDRLYAWFEDDALDKALDLDPSWWVASMLGSKQATARFPVTVLQRRGPRSLTAEPLVHVGTIHSFKGAEADHVILYPDLSPSGMVQWSRGGSGRDAVRRLAYVGMTRARQTLTLAGPSSPYTLAW